jgi:hypothetical protein
MTVIWQPVLGEDGRRWQAVAERVTQEQAGGWASSRTERR